MPLFNEWLHGHKLTTKLTNLPTHYRLLSKTIEQRN